MLRHVRVQRAVRRAFVLGMVSGGAAAAAAEGVQLSPGHRRRRRPRGDEPPPLLRFGVITDIQYCDIEDRFNASRTRSRAYRGALVCLQKAVLHWNATDDLAFVAHLGACPRSARLPAWKSADSAGCPGDIVDQECAARGDSHEALATVLAEFAKVRTKLTLPEGWGATAPVPAGTPQPFLVHLVGNHELYNFTREELREKLGTNGPPPCDRSYYSFLPHKLLRIVVLDSYDVNTIDNVEHHPPSHDEGFAFLEQQNMTDLDGRGKVDWLQGLNGKQRRFNPLNGSVGADQLKWLGEELDKADAAGERVIILGHVPMCPQGAKDMCLLWNYKEVLDVLNDHPSVVACFHGHDHEGGYRQDTSGIHHVTFQSPLNSVAGGSEPRQAHATVCLYPDRLELDGAGIIPSRTLRFNRGPNDPQMPVAGGVESGRGQGHRQQLDSLVAEGPAGRPLELSTDTLPSDSIHGYVFTKRGYWKGYKFGWTCDRCGLEGKPTDVR